MGLPVRLCPPVPPCWSCSLGVAAFQLPEPCIPSKATCFTGSTSFTRLSQAAFILLHPITALPSSLRALRAFLALLLSVVFPRSFQSFLRVPCQDPPSNLPPGLQLCRLPRLLANSPPVCKATATAVTLRPQHLCALGEFQQGDLGSFLSQTNRLRLSRLTCQVLWSMVETRMTSSPGRERNGLWTRKKKDLYSGVVTLLEQGWNWGSLYFGDVQLQS